MPIVRVSMFEGRSDEQKERLADAIATAMSEIAGSNRAGVNVLFDDVQAINWYQGGKRLGHKSKVDQT